MKDHSGRSNLDQNPINRFNNEKDTGRGKKEHGWLVLIRKLLINSTQFKNKVIPVSTKYKISLYYC